MPWTRARTSMSREPAVWPTYSKVAGRLAVVTFSTATAAGGGPPPGPPWPSGPPWALPQALRMMDKATEPETATALRQGNVGEGERRLATESDADTRNPSHSKAA